MGLVASQARLLYLTAAKSDLEYKVQGICQERADLAQQQALLSQIQAGAQDAVAQRNCKTMDQLQTDIKAQGDKAIQEALKLDLAKMSEMDGAFKAKIKGQLDRIQAQDKRLEVCQKNLETQRDAKMTEIESVQKVIEKNISMTFNPFKNS